MGGGEAVPSSVVITWYPFATSQPLRQNCLPPKISAVRREGWAGEEDTVCSRGKGKQEDSVLLENMRYIIM